MEQDHQTVNSADLGSDRPTQEQDSAPSNPNVADSHTAAGGQSDGCPSDGCPSDGRDFQQLMAASPTLSSLAGWLKCLRKPAISVEYSFKTRHVPDLDQDCAQIGQSGRSSSGGSFNADGSVH